MGEQATFYTVSDAGFFPGTVALLNSLRLTGHRHQLCVADAGFTGKQRTRLQSLCTVVSVGRRGRPNPQLLKPFPYALAPSGTIVITDSDFIVTASLEDTLAACERGMICVFADPEEDRWFATWQDAFALPNPPRRQPYVSSGFVAFSTNHWPDLLGLWWRACRRVPSRRTALQGASNRDALAQSDQDALNAILMSQVPERALALLPPEDRPVPIDPVKIQDVHQLKCFVGTRRVKLVHRGGKRKPWRRGSWWEVKREAYTMLFPRVVLARDVPLKLAPTEVPIWLRDGLGGRLTLGLLGNANRVTWGIYLTLRAAWIDRQVGRSGKTRRQN
jgi:hypothetical protein